MNFFTWLTTKRQTLTTMNAAELRAQEMLLENERNRMQSKMSKIAADKQKVIDQGAKEKTPELRRTFAQQFDLLHTEQRMVSRHLNIRSKELLTVSRLRMLRESAQRSGLSSAGIGTIREQDLVTIERLIESDKISTEMYQERLDQILELSQEDEGTPAVSPAAEELMKIWGDMDAGLIKDSSEAFEEAEKRVRERQKATDA